MRSPQNPELSFLIESLHLSPDAVFEALYKNHAVWGLKDVMDLVVDMTKKSVGMMDLQRFTPEVVDSWSHFVREKEWKPVARKNTSSVFEFIRKLAVEYLLIQNGEPFFKIDKLDEWQDVSFHCGEDLFVAAMYAEKNIKEGYSPRDFQWNYILKSDYFLLNNLIAQNKIVDNHYHLGGSAPMVDLSWIYLMNHPYGQEKRYEDFLKMEESFYSSAHSLNELHQSGLESLVKAAASLRLWLFQKCVLGKKESPQQKKEDTEDDILKEIYQILNYSGVLQDDSVCQMIETYLYESGFTAFGSAVDYAIIGFRVYGDECNSYISGERHLNYCVLRHIFSHPKDSDTQVLYYLYLLIKNHFDRYFIQSNNKTGFQNFREYNDRKSNLILGTKYHDMATNMALQGNIQENHLMQLEVRVVPNASAKGLAERIDNTDLNSFLPSYKTSRFERIRQMDSGCGDHGLDEGTDKFFYVLHFTKNKDANWYSGEEHKYAPLCRENAKREECRRMAETLMEMRNNNEEVCKRIFGIDGANNEVNFRPENFGTAFRYLSSSQTIQDVPWKREIPGLRKTFHVGEDFYEVVDGLRAIDEAVMYLELSHGDRIGHGVALGIDVDKWYERHTIVALPLQNKIDNIAWMLYKIREWGLSISTAYYEKLYTEFERLFLKLYRTPFPGLLAYMTAWELRGDDPMCYFAHKPEVRWLNPVTPWERYSIRDTRLFHELVESSQGDKMSMVYDLYHRYHFDTDLKRTASKIVMHEFNQDEFAEERVNLVKQLQLRMRSCILEKGIAIESCPSSNFLISNLDQFKEVPTFSLFPIREAHASFERLNVCINTDDQGVFYTNLVKEYTLLAGTLRKQKNGNLRELSDDKILNWIKHLIDNSKQLCFRTGEVEHYGVR